MPVTTGVGEFELLIVTPVLGDTDHTPVSFSAGVLPDRAIGVL